MDAHHFGITVEDLDSAVAFYRDELGLELIERFSVSGEGFETGVGVPDAKADFAHLDLGDARLELVAYDPQGENRRGGSVNDAGAKHLGIGVESVRAVYESLSDAVETLSEPQTTASGSIICFVRDPEGNLIELIET
jgi:catechol 2,3-dioxygenase-like lactoylglutathione lyase family enzyme